MEIVVTGGAGFIGTHLVNLLHASGYSVTVIDNLESEVHGEVPVVKLPKDVRFHKMDIHTNSNNGSQLTGILDGKDAVIHLAALTSVKQSFFQAQKYTRTNVSGTACLIDALRKIPNRPRRLVLAGSCASLGEGDATAPFTEDAPHRPLSVYGATKASQEMLVSSACPSLGIEYSILRLWNVYGEGQSIKSDNTGVAALIGRNSLLGKPITIYDDGNQTRDFIHVSDVARAFTLALTRKPGVYNIGSGKPIQILAFAKAIMDAAGHKAINITGKPRVGDIRHSNPLTVAASTGLEFSPNIDLKTGIKRLLTWISKELENVRV